MNCCEIQAGMLRQRVQLQRKQEVDDGYGGFVGEWVTYANANAMVKPVSGSERVAGMQVESPVTHDILMRYRTGLLESDRIVLRGRPFNIRVILTVEERNRWLHIKADEGVSQ
jgi:SPP1 family predicted phage head-tail adaptor